MTAAEREFAAAFPSIFDRLGETVLAINEDYQFAVIVANFPASVTMQRVEAWRKEGKKIEDYPMHPEAWSGLIALQQALATALELDPSHVEDSAAMAACRLIKKTAKDHTKLGLFYAPHGAQDDRDLVNIAVTCLEAKTTRLAGEHNVERLLRKAQEIVDHGS